MAIQVTCGKCLTRFTVNDKFAGQKGPCPKCKAIIAIPKSSDEVKVHEAPRGPKDAAGRPVLKPLFRQETEFTAIHWTIAACTAFVMLSVAIVARNVFPEVVRFPWWALVLGALLVAMPVSLVGYAVLRNPESPGLVGRELWVRLALGSLGFTVLWLCSPLAAYAFGHPIQTPGLLSQSLAIAAILLLGGAVSLLCFEFDYLMGVVHASSYVVLCLAMRWLAGLPPLPGMKSNGTDPAPQQRFGLWEPADWPVGLPAELPQQLWLSCWAWVG